MGHDVLGFRLRNGITRDQLVNAVPFTYSTKDIIDVTANGDKPYTCEGEIAYNRRGAGNEINNALYRALGSQEHYCGCSGCGSEDLYNREQLELALQRIQDEAFIKEHWEIDSDENIQELFEQEKTFFEDCLANLNDEGYVLISFG
jgi:hypothetical protein